MMMSEDEDALSTAYGPFAIRDTCLAHHVAYCTDHHHERQIQHLH